MESYEIVWEIFNKCSNNQMRDVHIEEQEVADTDQYVMNKFHDKDFTYEKEILPDGTIIYEVLTTGIRQRVSFTPI